MSYKIRHSTGDETPVIAFILLQKFIFFSGLKGDLFLNFCNCRKKTYNQENISFMKTRHTIKSC